MHAKSILCQSTPKIHNASIDTPKIASNDMHKTEMRQKSPPKSASIDMEKMICVKNHPKKVRQLTWKKWSASKIILRHNSVRQKSPCINFPRVKGPASKATPLSQKVKIPASQFRASNIPCVTRPPPPKAYQWSNCPFAKMIPSWENWQINSLVTHILFELQPIIIFSPVANFGDQSLVCNVRADNWRFSVKKKEFFFPFWLKQRRRIK